MLISMKLFIAWGYDTEREKHARAITTAGHDASPSLRIRERAPARAGRHAIFADDGAADNDAIDAHGEFSAMILACC